MKINESAIENIINGIIEMDLPDFEIVGNIGSHNARRKERKFELPVKIRIKKI